MELLIATRNEGKRREFEMMLGGVFPPEVQFVDIAHWPTELPEVIEDRETFLGNAVKKAVELSHAAGVSAMSEDSGLVVDALDGAPGIYSARFAGDDATDAQNNALLLERLIGVPLDERSAHYSATICLALIEGEPLGDRLIEHLTRSASIVEGVPDTPGVPGRIDERVVAWWQGTMHGRITTAARGDGGFGYDPLFEVPQWGKTNAEVSPEQKNSISHRAEALVAMTVSFAP